MEVHEPRNSARTGPHLVYDFHGSPYQIGFQYGEILRDEILTGAVHALRSHSRQRRTGEAAFLDWVVDTYEPVFETYVPTAIEEIRGIADGSALGYPFAFFAAIRDGLLPFEEEARTDCTAAACGSTTTRDGTILLGQTKDTSAPLNRYRIMRLAYASGQRLVLLNYPGWMANICLTSKGLSFTGNTLYAQEPARGTVPFSLIKRLVMERSSVSEVLEAIQGLSFQNLCMILGDSQGSLVCLESVMGRLSQWDVSDRAFGRANSVLDTELRRYEKEEEVPASSPTRQRNIQKLLDRSTGSLSVEALKRIFADHQDAPHSICQHLGDEGTLATTAAYICDLSALEFHLAIGNPCAAEFKIYGLDF